MGDATAIFSIHDKKDYEIHEIVQQVYDALKEKGYNPVNQLVIQGFLGKRGYQVRLVTNGRNAVEEFRRAPQRYQLILMDCEMPEMDGFEATRQIRQFEQQQGLLPVPVIALTAHIFEEHRAEGQRAGMNEFLGKPVDRVQLYSTLDRYLDSDA